LIGSAWRSKGHSAREGRSLLHSGLIAASAAAALAPPLRACGVAELLPAAVLALQRPVARCIAGWRGWQEIPGEP